MWQVVCLSPERTNFAPFYGGFEKIVLLQVKILIYKK